jgi:hypothetical protein
MFVPWKKPKNEPLVPQQYSQLVRQHSLSSKRHGFNPAIGSNRTGSITEHIPVLTKKCAYIPFTRTRALLVKTSAHPFTQQTRIQFDPQYKQMAQKKYLSLLANSNLPRGGFNANQSFPPHKDKIILLQLTIISASSLRNQTLVVTGPPALLRIHY